MYAFLKSNFTTLDWRQSKNALDNRQTRIKSRPETVFSIAICRQSVDKWQSKTLFLTNFNLRLLTVLTFSIAFRLVCSRTCD